MRDTYVDPAAGRTPRPLSQLRTMLEDRGWTLSVIGETEVWRHYASPGEDLKVPRYQGGTAQYDRLYDAVMERLGPLPPDVLQNVH